MALRKNNTVIVLEEEDIARNREVTVLRRGREKVWISDGLNNGEKVVLKGLRGVTKEGIKVHIAEGPTGPDSDTSAEAQPEEPEE